MKPKIIVSAGILLAFWLIFGCETKTNQDWSGFGSTTHFPAPYENDHAGYMEANDYPFASCQECHGEDLEGGTSGVSCLECHHPFGDAEDDHPDYLRENLYPLADCQVCHGENFDGNPVGESCLECHTEPGGPEACNTCHGNFDGDPDLPLDQAPLENGAHQAHLTGGEHSRIVECSACHVVPETWDAAGHIDPPPAEIQFSGLAVADSAEPAWNETEETCSGTYCHGDAEPNWEDDEAECGSCHAVPPPEPHFQAELDQCVWCHSLVMDASGEIIQPDLHVNGEIDLNP